MAVDKLVDSTQLDTDLTSIANAIRTKGGTSAQLAFPAEFVSAIGAISGGVNSAISFDDFVMPTTFAAIQNCVPNLLKSGGCVHIVYTLQTNTNPADKNIIGFGYGAPTGWSPSSPNIGAYFTVSKNTNWLNIYFRGAGLTSFNLAALADANNRVDVKLYADHYVNVNTGESVAYGTDIQAFFTALNQHDYISVISGNNTPFAGAVIEHWAIEEA